MCVSAAVGAVIGGGFALFGAKKSADRADDLYDKQYANQMSAEYANAEAELEAAHARAGAIIAGAAAQARAAEGSARAEAEGVRAGALAESQAAAEAAAAAQAEALANVRLMKEEAEESLRRLENEQSVYEEKAKAKAGASGVTMAGSTGQYLQAMDEENTRQYTWLDKAYTNQQQVERENAKRNYAASMAYSQAIKTSGFETAKAIETGGRLVAAAYKEGAHAEAGATVKIAKIGKQAVQQSYAAAPGGYNSNLATNITAAWNKKQSGQLSYLRPQAASGGR